MFTSLICTISSCIVSRLETLSVLFSSEDPWVFKYRKCNNQFIVDASMKTVFGVKMSYYAGSLTGTCVL